MTHTPGPYTESIVDAVAEALGVDTGTIAEHIFAQACRVVEQTGAPELLEAAEAVVGCYNRGPEPSMTRLITAIAKAKGE